MKAVAQSASVSVVIRCLAVEQTQWSWVGHARWAREREAGNTRTTCRISRHAGERGGGSTRQRTPHSVRAEVLAASFAGCFVLAESVLPATATQPRCSGELVAL